MLHVLWFVLAVASPGAAAKDISDAVFEQRIGPLISTFCLDCHDDGSALGDLSLEGFRSVRDLRNGRATWLRVLGQLRAGHMPPEEADQPSAEERQLLIEWLDRAVNEVDCDGPVDPGRVTLRRLNRHEYRNTIRDLLGIDYEPAADFPADDVGYGFDNIGDVLSLPTLLMEKYLAAAEQISQTMNFPQPDETTPVADAAREVLTPLATRAFRRPVEPREIDRLIGLVELAGQEGDDFEAGIQLALQAILVSPHFLFRVELDPEEGQEVRQLNDYELATRLSYFLWSSMPDDELFEAARNGSLREEGEWERQVRRMLADPKIEALIENFAGQWLQLRSLDDLTFDAERFPDCDRELLAAMRTETTRFFGEVVRADLSLLRLLDADFTFVNERLARHYGLDGVVGESFRRVSLAGTARAGIMTHASILAVTSNPTRTSPVKRGKFVLENLLGSPPPPAPEDVPALEDDGRQLTGTLRERMVEHRTNPSCASCHQLMDPIGFALEHFDAVGRYRTHDEGLPIDATGELPSGETFSGAAQLRDLLLRDKRDDLVQCLTEKMLVYALGRGIEYYDRCATDRIAQSVAEDDYRFSRLVLEVVKSEPFQLRGRKRSEP